MGSFWSSLDEMAVVVPAVRDGGFLGVSLASKAYG